jgi:hypothetical protein
MQRAMNSPVTFHAGKPRLGSFEARTGDNQIIEQSNTLRDRRSIRRGRLDLVQLLQLLRR